MRKVLYAALMGLLIGQLAFGADIKSQIGEGDINFGVGTFSRRTSTGGSITLNRVDASHLPLKSASGYFVDDLFDGGYGLTIYPSGIVGNGTTYLKGFLNLSESPPYAGAGGTTDNAAVIDVRAHGAKGDGVTDDTAEWAAAIAACSGVRCIVDGASKTYLFGSKVSISIDNVEIRNASFYVVRDTKDTVNPDNNFAFYISGAASQKDVVFRNLNFFGSGYWGGIYSKPLKIGLGWLDNVYGSVDETNYTTTRKRFGFYDLYFDTPSQESIALTNVQADMRGVVIDNSLAGGPHVSAIVVRDTQDVNIEDVLVRGYGGGKAINTSYVDGVHYTNIRAIGDNNAGLGLYIGHFDRDFHITNCSVRGKGNTMKVSYNASSGTISDVVFDVDGLEGTSGYAMFQGAKNVTWSDSIVKGDTSQLIYMHYHTDWGAIHNSNISLKNLTVISSDDGSILPKTVNLSYSDNVTLSGSKIIGRVYAYPVRSITIRDSDIYYSTDNTSPGAAIYAQDFTTGDGIIRIERNRIETIEEGHTIYVNGGDNVGNVYIVGNEISNNAATNYAVVANNFTTGDFVYSGNIPFGTKTYKELFVSYDTADNVLRDYQRLRASSTWDPASCADNDAVTSDNVTVTHAAVGDHAECSLTTATTPGLILTGQVIAANVAVCTLKNMSGGTVDVAEGTLYISVRRQ